MNFFFIILRHRAMIGALAFRDFQSRYAATVAGSLWTLAHPLAVVVVFYFVFSVGFKAKAPDNVPFILWFSVGLMAWFYFNDALIAITGSVTRNSHLVKKTVFPVEVLAVVQMISALIPHLGFLSIISVVLLLNNLNLEVFRLLVFYYMFATSILILGVGWFLSALEVFYKDISQGLSIVMNLWFWVTPIVWDPALMPEKYHWVFSWNPMHYIVDGYRGMLIYSKPIWPGMSETLYFWSVALAFLAFGAMVFRRLKTEFADVL